MKGAGKKHILISSIGFGIIILDQIIKYIVSKTMELNQSIPVINKIFHITYMHNFGAGFSILQGQRWLLITVAFLVIGLIAYYYNSLPKKTHLPVALILGGTIGNLIDRIFLGYVIDFLDFRIWPAFNVADSALTIGAILLIIYFWKDKKIQ